ncbi:MAG: chloride channel protein [Bdellovibrio sp.]|nr:MAG: chloride channel protein [Bdellovibrio sp.]
MVDSKNYKKRYNELRAYAEDLTKHLNEILHGHIHIKSLHIDYDFPQEVVSYHHWRNRIYIFIAASLIGVFAVLFARSSDGSYHIFRKLYEYNQFAPLIVTPLGLVIVRWLTTHVFKGAEGSGIPQVIASMGQRLLSPKLLSFSSGLGKLIGTNLALLSGASVGREGPTVQLSAVIIRYFSFLLRAPVIYTERSLILAGGAAGISAAFNTPIAGVVFAIEELGKSFYEQETSVLLMAIVVAGLAALSLSGPYFYFGLNNDSITGWAQLYAIPIGILSGLYGGAFCWLLLKGVQYMKALPAKKAYGMTFLFGLIIAGIGIITHGATFGSGYESAKALLNGEALPQGFHFLGDGLYSLFKFISTLLSYLTGTPGGIFSPTLSIGAGVGHWFVTFFHLPHSSAFILCGMVAFFSGVIRSPITAVIIVSEMTGNHTILLSLLLSSLVAYASSKLIAPKSLYHALAEGYLSEKKTEHEV